MQSLLTPQIGIGLLLILSGVTITIYRLKITVEEAVNNPHLA